MDIIKENKIRRILAIRTDRMGDLLLSIPAFRALKQSFTASLAVLVSPAGKELLESIPEIDEIIVFDEDKWKRSIIERFYLWEQLRRGRFNLAVVFNPAKRWHILVYLAAIPLRLGYNRKWGFLLTHRIEDKKFMGEKHEVEYNLDLVRSIGADIQDKGITIKPEGEDCRFVEELLAKSGIRDKDLVIAVHPYSSNPAKCWPDRHYACLNDELYARLGSKVVVVGGPGEKEKTGKIFSYTKHPVVDLTGILTLKQLAAFLQRCALLVSNDSGPAHIAAAVNTPAIVIFGRNIPGVSPVRWGPWGEGHIVLHKASGCNPCFEKACPYNFRCLSAITPEEVLQAVETKLNKRDARK